MAVFGIHFGTTSACIASCKDGKLDVLANDSGDRVTPATVAFTDHDQTVGLPAKQGIIRNASNTICNVKQLIGRRFDDPVTQRSVDNSAAKVVEKDGRPVYEVQYKEKLHQLTPVDAAELIFKKLIETADCQAGGSVTHDAVLAVPHYFTDEQRDSLKQAAVSSGFNILRVIGEGSAALLAYEAQQKDSKDLQSNVVVYRIGHTSADASVIAVNSSLYRIVATSVDHDLGGHIINDTLVDYLASEFQRQQSLDCRSSQRSLSRLHVAVETCKHILSTMSTAHCSVDSLMDGCDFSSHISRSRFESLLSGFIQRCHQLLIDSLQKAAQTPEDVDKVVLSGGCLKMPLLRQQIQDWLPNAQVLSAIAPDEVVAVGSAYQASILAGHRGDDEVAAHSTSDPFGCLSVDILVKVEGDSSSFTVIFPKFTPVPSRKHRNFNLARGSSSACLHVLQRDGQLEPRSLAKVVLADLPDDGLLETIFHLRSDGSLHVSCTESQSKKTQSLVVECG